MKQLPILIQELLTPLELTTKIIDKPGSSACQILIDFCCDTNDAQPNLDKVSDLLAPLKAMYSLNVAETFSDGTAFCTIQIDFL